MKVSVFNPKNIELGVNLDEFLVAKSEGKEFHNSVLQESKTQFQNEIEDMEIE